MLKLGPFSRVTPPLQPVSLLDLPSELRLQIYRHCVPRNRLVSASASPSFIPRCSAYEEVLGSDHMEEEEGDWDWEAVEEAGNRDDSLVDDVEDNDKANENTEVPTQDRWIGAPDLVGLSDTKQGNNGLLRVSKQMSGEALDILYGENTFEVCLLGKHQLQNTFSERNRRRMRHMIVVARHVDVRIPPGWKPDHDFWRSTLPGLKSFRLVALEPKADNRFYSREERLDMWLMWINPFLICFGQHLQQSTPFEVEVHDGADIIELIKVHFPHGYRQISSRQWSHHLETALLHHRLRDN